MAALSVLWARRAVLAPFASDRGHDQRLLLLLLGPINGNADQEATHLMRLFAIDPGMEQSGFVVYDPAGAGTLLEHGIEDNEILLARCWKERDPADEYHLAIEMPDAAGMAGRSLFETCYWVGRFLEAFGPEAVTRVPRHAIRRHLLHAATGNDALIRQALIARWGGKAIAIGGKGRGILRTPRGPLHGIASHAWAALAVAVTWSETRGKMEP